MQVAKLWSLYICIVLVFGVASIVLDLVKILQPLVAISRSLPLEATALALALRLLLLLLPTHPLLCWFGGRFTACLGGPGLFMAPLGCGASSHELLSTAVVTARSSRWGHPIDASASGRGICATVVIVPLGCGWKCLGVHLRVPPKLVCSAGTKSNRCNLW